MEKIVVKQFKVLLKVLKGFGLKVPLGVKLLIPVLIGLGFFLWLRKKKKAEEEQGGGEATNVSSASTPALQPNQLRKVWLGFLSSIPAVFRRSLNHFQHFVVLGSAGSGKTQLISEYTDWQQQAQRFLDSETEDPDLQIYLSSKAVVQELPASILYDTSKATRKALLNLWRPLFRNKRPIVVVPVNVANLLRSPHDTVRHLSETTRGKISMLSLIHNESIEVRVALTHLDSLDGYDEFSRFCEKEGIPLNLKVGTDFQPSLQKHIEAFNDYLPNALTKLPATEYKQIVRFLKQFPSIVPSVADFLGALFAPSSFDKEPKLAGVFLTHKDYLGPNANPFRSVALPEHNLRQSPLLRHRVIATTAAVVGCVYLMVGYVEERRSFRAANSASDKFTGKNKSSRDMEARKAIFRFVEREEKDPLSSMFPSFFSGRQEELKNRFVSKMRSNQLLPGLRKSLVTQVAHQKSLYFLAAIYATKDSALAELILQNLADFEYALNIEKKILVQYLESAEEPFERLVNLEALPGQISQTPATSSVPWKEFFDLLSLGLQRKFVSTEEIEQIHSQAAGLITSLDDLRAYSSALQILQTLSEETPYDFNRIYRPFRRQLAFQEVFGDKLQLVEEFLRIIQSSRVTSELSDSSLLSELVSKLQGLNLVEQSPNADYTFEMAEATWTFNTNAWFTLIRDSNVRQLVLNFIARIQKDKLEGRDSKNLFFVEDAKYPELRMNSTNNGTFMFTGQASIPGHLTREAYLKQVLPVVLDFTTLLAELRLDPENRRLLETFVYQAMDDYATDYANAVSEYYQSFDSEARSAEGVQMIAKQMLKPLSAFEDFLKTTYSATSIPIDVEKSSFLLPLQQAMQKYTSFNKVMTETEQGLPELNKYRAILEQLFESLRESKTAVAAEEGGKSSGAEGGRERLEDFLSPAGKLSLAILQSRDGSFLEQVKTWLASVNIQGDLGRPFLSPIRQLYFVGIRNVENNVATLWRHQILRDLEPVLSKFPFDSSARNEVRGEEITALFHPKTGRFFEEYRKYIAPVSRQRFNQFEQKDSYLRELRLPNNMYVVINRIAKLSNALWDTEGKPKPYELQISPIPFDSFVSSDKILTLVYLSSGSSSLFNFNQKPFFKKIQVDWTKLQTSQVGIQLTATQDEQKIYPAPLVTGDSHWSFLRLLRRAKNERENIWDWTFELDDESGQKINASFTIAEQPWKLFEIRKLTRPLANGQ